MTTNDFAQDFDLLDTDYVRDPGPVWADLRERCPIAFTERWGRTWMPVRYEDVSAIAHDTEHFSSRDIAVINTRRELDPEGIFRLIAPPITSDPPDHTWARRLLLPAFGPTAIERMSGVTRGLANELLDGFVDAGTADAATDYAQHIPVRIIATMLGVPLSDEELFTSWAVRILQDSFTDIEKASGAVMELISYFSAALAEREAVPVDDRPDDLMSLLLASTDEDGAPLSEQHKIGACFLLLIAGIDTTWSSISSSLWHLAAHPEDQARLRAEPELLPTAVEELLRFYSPVTMAREVIRDVEVGGCPMRSGDKVLLTFPAGNRDPKLFDDPDRFVIDRERNRHFAFGSGIHRCLGSNLARMELRIAIEEFVRRIPPFELADPDAVTWTGGQVRGPRRVPVRW